MPTARKHVVIPGEPGWYHCISRCVRRGFAQGVNHATGKDYRHRRDWVEGRLRQLSQVFAIDHAAYAVMDNHVHVVIRSEPERARGWTDEEVARRWLAVFPSSWTSTALRVPTPAALAQLLADPERLQCCRDRLACVSWFMRCLNEWVARRANNEEGCTGRYWEGRFRCQRIADSAGLLACMVYVDLNPVRARMVNAPEESRHTSFRQRVENQRLLAEGRRMSPPSWLLDIDAIFNGEREDLPRIGWGEYFDLVDSQGRRERGGKGTIPAHLGPILERLGLEEAAIPYLLGRVGRLFGHVIGSPRVLRREAAARGRAFRPKSPEAASLYRTGV